MCVRAEDREVVEMGSLVEPSTGLVDVTATPLTELRRNPTARQAEQSQLMINELLVAVPASQDQLQGAYTTTYENI
jgi:hypothetical protein